MLGFFRTAPNIPRWLSVWQTRRQEPPFFQQDSGPFAPILSEKSFTRTRLARQSAFGELFPDFILVIFAAKRYLELWNLIPSFRPLASIPSLRLSGA